MKACVLKGIGQLSYEDVPTPEPKKGEVLLQIKRCGICSSDIDRVFKTGTYHFPTIPGHEFSGQVAALGEGVDSALLGRRAAVFPLLPCFRCPSCRAGEYARCDSYSYFGSRCDGAFAEYLAVPVWNLAFFSESLSYEAAAMCEPAAVALHAVKAAGAVQGGTVAVVGSGTIGLLAALWAQQRGAGRVIIIGRGAERLKMAGALGFTHTVSTLSDDPEQAVKALTDGAGADVVLEMAGLPDTVDAAIRCTKKGGTTVLTGNPAGDMTMKRATYWRILRSELRLAGTWNSSYSAEKNDWADALRCMERGLLPVEKLITHRFALEDHEKAFQTLRDRSSGAVKVMFRVSG